ncbi:MAG: hypothetical protein O3B12_06625, partial [Proteobacteria bacterium]|nr:hypothetical protein [Pseudomonadota bacterium]
MPRAHRHPNQKAYHHARTAAHAQSTRDKADAQQQKNKRLKDWDPTVAQPTPFVPTSKPKTTVLSAVLHFAALGFHNPQLAGEHRRSIDGTPTITALSRTFSTVRSSISAANSSLLSAFGSAMQPFETNALSGTPPVQAVSQSIVADGQEGYGNISGFFTRFRNFASTYSSRSAASTAQFSSTVNALITSMQANISRIDPGAPDASAQVTIAQAEFQQECDRLQSSSISPNLPTPSVNQDATNLADAMQQFQQATSAQYNALTSSRPYQNGIIDSALGNCPSTYCRIKEEVDSLLIASGSSSELSDIASSIRNTGSGAMQTTLQADLNAMVSEQQIILARLVSDAVGNSTENGDCQDELNAFIATQRQLIADYTSTSTTSTETSSSSTQTSTWTTTTSTFRSTVSTITQTISRVFITPAPTPEPPADTFPPSQPPTPAPSTQGNPPTSPGDKRGGDSSATIAGIVAALTVSFLALVGGILFYKARHKNDGQNP